MSNPITTKGLSNGDVSTSHNSGETTAAWENRHVEAVEKRLPSGSLLTTTWTSADGAEKLETTRQPGESAESFRARHILDISEAMLNHPPIP